MNNFQTEIRTIFDKSYIKVFLNNVNDLEKIKKELSNLDGIKKVNITQNTKTDLTVYPDKFTTVDKLKITIENHLIAFYQGATVNHSDSKSETNRGKKTPSHSKKQESNKSSITEDVGSETKKLLSIRIVIPIIIMLSGVFFFTPLRQKLFGEGKVVINENNQTEQGDIIHGDKIVTTMDPFNELQPSKEEQKKRCIDIFYKQQPILDKAIDDLKFENLNSYSAMQLFLSKKERKKAIRKISGLNTYLSKVSGFSDIYMTNINEGTEYHGTFLTEFERVSMAKLFCGNFELELLINFNEALKNETDDSNLNQEKLDAASRNLKALQKTCMYQDSD